MTGSKTGSGYMKLIYTIKSFLVLALSFAFIHCGSDGTDNQVGFGNTGAFSGFYTVSSSPGHNQFYVAKTTHTLTVRMSEPVDQASIVSQVRLFKKTNGQEEDVTAAYNISVVGEIITLQGSADLVDNSDYSIHLYPGLKATSGNTLLQGQSFQYFFMDFATGNGQNLGQSLAGPPTISSFGDAGYSMGARTIMVTFSESLAYAPLIEFHSTSIFLGQNIVPAYVVPANSNNNTQWYAIMPQGYSPLAFDVKVTDYVDLEGNHGDPKVSQNFYF
jgi:hypothetical protein